MSNKNVEAVDNIAMAPVDPDKVLAKIVMDEDGNFHVQDMEGNIGPVCKLVDEGDKTIALTPNASNRKWYNKAKAIEAIEADGYCPLYFKASKVFGPRGSVTPNAKLLQYMTDEDKATYLAIVEAANKRLEEERNKPKTELEKAQEAMERARRKYEELIKKAGEINVTEEN